MRWPRPGALVAAALLAVQQAAAPGVSTLELDEIAESVIRDGGGVPSFLGYHGFPASICSSVNDRVVHGIPSADEVLAPGDLVSIDCGAILDGWHGDSAVTFGVGDADRRRRGAVGRPPGSRWRPASPRWCPATGSPTSSHAIETGTHAAEARYDRTFGIVAGYGGHGIGRQMHMDPFLPNEGAPGRGPLPGAGFGAGHRTDADPRHHEDRGARRRMDRRHRRRVPRRALGAHRRRHRRRAANPHRVDGS